MSEKIKPIELDFVNVYLVRADDGFILIDTGMPFHWERLEKELIRAGCLPDKLKLVIITHGDRDHIGNCAKFQAKYKVKVAIHQADAFMAEGTTMLKRKVRTLAAKIRMLKVRFFGPKIILPKFKPDMFLDDNQSLEVYGLKAKIIHLAGHTRGSIGVLTEDGDLFSGDTLVNTKKPDIAVYVDSFSDLKNSLAKLKKLNIKKVYPGHGKTFLFSELKT